MSVVPIVPCGTYLGMESTLRLQESRTENKRMWVAKQTKNCCQIAANAQPQLHLKLVHLAIWPPMHLGLFKVF